MRKLGLVLVVLGAALAFTGCLGGDDDDDDTGAGGSGGGGGGTGELTCGEILTCGSQCDTEACMTECVENGTEAAQQAFADYVQCYNDAGCQDGECAQTECGDELVACAGGELPAATCGDMFDCAMACQSETCVDDCRAEGDATEQASFDDVVSCLIENECQDTDCLQTYCSDQLMACYSDLAGGA